MNLELEMLIEKLQMFAYSCIPTEQKLSWLRMWNDYVVIKEAKKFPKLDFSNS
jgi:hypothetical protein